MRNGNAERGAVPRISFLVPYREGLTGMAHLTLRLDHDCAETACAECGHPLGAYAEPRLVWARSSEEAEARKQGTVCRDCGRRHAPSLVALLDLARTAQRVARMDRHTIVPPLNALLDLARAAENYSHLVHERRRRAA